MARWKQPYRDRHGRPQEACAESVAELRVLRARLIADPDVEQIAGTVQCGGTADISVVERCSECGRAPDGNTGGVMRHETCRCGIVHTVLRCTGPNCWKTTWTPPRHDGCGEIAWDNQGVADRLYYKGPRRRWRPA